MPSSPDDPMGWYDAHADALESEYEALSVEQVHGWLHDLLPDTRQR
jgi:hypothetical protein